MTAFLRGVAAQETNSATRYVSQQRFVQHGLSKADGLAGLREQIGRSPGNGACLQVVRTLEDGAFILVHGRDEAGGSKVFFAASRFEDDLIVEHWRYSAAAAPPNESGHTQTDGPTHSDGSQDTDKNKALVRDYSETVHIAGRHDRIERYMSGDRQVRHEPGVRDGVAAFRRDLATLTLSRTIDEIELLLGQVDFVFIMAKGTHEGKSCAYLDLYRVEADKLVEHWGFPEQA